MSRIIDNVVAFRVISMLVTPFVDTAAYKLGIIDEKGHNLKKTYTLKTAEERDSYTYLHRLVFNMKKILSKLPGGDSKLKNVIASLFLVKEYYEKNDRMTSLMEQRLVKILEKLDDGVVLAEEELAVKKFLHKLSEEGEGASMGAAPANVTGAMVSTDKTKIYPKNIKKYRNLNRRKAPLPVGTK